MAFTQPRTVPASKPPAIAGLPYDGNVEQAQVSLMLKHKDNILRSSSLNGEDFYEPVCSAVFQTIRKLTEEGKFVDTRTVLDKSKTLGLVLSHQTIEWVFNTPTHSDNIEEYIKLLKLKTTERKLIQASYKISEISNDPLMDVNDKINLCSQSLTGLSYNMQDKTKRVDLAFDDMLADLEEVIKNKDRKMMEWGYAKVDNALGGIATGLHILGANTGMGKTSLVDKVADHNALNGFKVLFFSAEMNNKELLYRKINRELGISVNKIRRGHIDETEMLQIRSFKERISQNLFLNDSSNLDVNKLKAIAHLQAAKTGLNLIVVDYLQLLTCAGKKNKYEEVSEISKQLKMLSKELNVPVIALAQLNRNNQKTESKKPGIADLRDSGSIEQDADSIIFIHRDDYFDPKTPRKGLVDLIIAKNRFGEVGTYLLKFVADRTDFREHYPAVFDSEPEQEFDGFDIEKEDFLKLRRK